MTKRNNPSGNGTTGHSRPIETGTPDAPEFRQDAKSCILFGIIGGFFLSLLSYLRAVSAEGGAVFVWFSFLAFGAILILTALIYPLALRPLQKIIRLFTGWILRAVLTVLLGATYAVYFIPVGLLLRHKREQFGFYSWKNKNDRKASYLVDSTATKRRETEQQTADKKTGAGKKISEQLSLLRDHRLMLLLPVLIFLLILGILFAFASSGIAEYFIYTLF